jgi:adenylosuccinate lyase
MKVPARSIADHMAEYVCLLGLLAASGGKIGREVFLLMKPEVGEVEETAPEGTVGSSTMPHKRNPQLSQDIIAISAEIRSIVPFALESVGQEHEADGAASAMMVEALSRACILTGGLLARLQLVLGGLALDGARMRANLDLTGGLIMSESVMLALGASIGRQHAHDVVYEATRVSDGRTFAQVLAADPRVTAHLDHAAIDALLDPSTHIGLSAEIAHRAASDARALAEQIAAEYANGAPNQRPEDTHFPPKRSN